MRHTNGWNDDDSRAGPRSPIQCRREESRTRLLSFTNATFVSHGVSSCRKRRRTNKPRKPPSPDAPWYVRPPHERRSFRLELRISPRPCTTFKQRTMHISTYSFNWRQCFSTHANHYPVHDAILCHKFFVNIVIDGWISRFIKLADLSLPNQILFQ